MNLTADLGGDFIVVDVTALALASVTNMTQAGPWETDWIVITLEEAMGPAGFVYFRSCFENLSKNQYTD